MPEKPERIDADYREIFKSDAGQRVLRHLMVINCVWDNAFDVDSHVTAHNEGKRNAVLAILHRVRYKPSPSEFVEDFTQSTLD